jgi:hypothetical protein
MADNTGRVDMQKAARSITMNVDFVGYRRLLWRLNFAVRLMQLAAWVAGVHFRVTSTTYDREYDA